MEKMNVEVGSRGFRGEDNEVGRESTFVNSGCSNSKAVINLLSGFDYFYDLLTRLLHNYMSFVAVVSLLLVIVIIKSQVWFSHTVPTHFQYPPMVIFDHDGRAVSSSSYSIAADLHSIYSKASHDKAIFTLSISAPKSIISSGYNDASMEFLVASSIYEVESLKTKSTTIDKIATETKSTKKSITSTDKDGHDKMDPFSWENINPMAFVLNLDNKYILLLNKFNTLDQHALLVTKTFKDQSSLLSSEDLVYWLYLVVHTTSLGVYNSNYISGASQKHKHMQIIPMSVLSDYRSSTEIIKKHSSSVDFPIPLEDVIHAFVVERNQDENNKESLIKYGQLLSLPIFHFSHGLIMLDPLVMSSKDKIGDYLLLCYEKLLASLFPDYKSSEDTSLLSYNLLTTSRWMFMVRRTRREYGEGMIGINALAYAGLLLARDADFVDLIEQAGPLNILEQVSAG